MTASTPRKADAQARRRASVPAKSPKRPPVVADAPPSTGASEVLPRRVRVGRLDTVTDWRRQVSIIYRETRRGLLHGPDATRLAYIADIGLKVAKYEEELAELRALKEALAVGRASPATASLAWESPQDGLVDAAAVDLTTVGPEPGEGA
jgi:hypothetical protein